jgi:glycosyltransferase involved in cell wall biosynthesis
MEERRLYGPDEQAVAPLTFRKLSVLMPVYNEARTLRTIVHRVLNAPIPLAIELVIVDDASTDGSRELIDELAAADGRIRPLFHEHNQGKAGAIRTAIAAMTGDLALVQDADLEYNPNDYPVLLQPMLDGIADAVFGSRFLSGSHRRVMCFWHTLANQLLTLLCNVLNNINLTDMETGYKLVRADVLKSIPLTSSGFAFEPELTTKLAQWGLRLCEVPISYAGRTYAEGKKITWKDAFKALWSMVKYRFFSQRFTTHEGFFILQSVRKARSFNRWLVQRIRPFVGQRVVEGGCGIGNLSEHFLDRDRLLCLDNDPFYTERIGRHYGHLANVSVHDADLQNLMNYRQVRESRPDTVVCINVLEHIEQDEKTLRGFYDVLQPGGHAIILVPAHPGLYTEVDRALGHCRRYTHDELYRKMRDAGFEVAHIEGFNRLGSLGWYVSGKWLGKTTLSPGQMKLYDRLVPIARLIEHVPVLPYLSLIAVGRKPLAGTQTGRTSEAA